MKKNNVQTTITSRGVTPAYSYMNMGSVIDYNTLIKNDSTNSNYVKRESVKNDKISKGFSLKKINRKKGY